MSIQTREVNGCTCQFETVKEAYRHAMRNPHVWKISFRDGGINRRFVRSVKGEHDEQDLCDLSEAYENAPIGSLFWVDQKYILSIGEEMLLIRMILSDEKFVRKYC